MQTLLNKQIKLAIAIATYVAIHIVVSYESASTYYHLLSSLNVPVDMVHPLQSNYQWCARLALYLHMIS